MAAGDRVLLYMQNSPQFVIAYYAILRANAVVVPVNPMYLTQEFLRCAQDAGATYRDRRRRSCIRACSRWSAAPISSA